MQELTNNFKLEDIKKEEYDAYYLCSPEGLDGGLPMLGYVKRGTAAERGLRTAKIASRGAPDQLYLVSGVARKDRILIVESVSKAE